MFVSCPAGGHNCGQLGGLNIFFVSLCIEMVEKMLEKKEKSKKGGLILQNVHR